MITQIFFRQARRWAGAAILFSALLGSPRGETVEYGVETRNYFGEGVVFDHPILFKRFPGEDSAVLVVQQFGAMIRMERQNGEWVRSRFDSAAVGVSNLTNNEDAGLLGFSFHPGYAENGRYFIYYVDEYSRNPFPGMIVLEERVADSTRTRRGGDSARVVLQLKKPHTWHNGGTLRFGEEGYLYTAIGDGGASRDPQGRAQNPTSLFGKMLRIDVDGSDAFPEDSTRNYAIPDDNPFVDSTDWLPEIWAYGLRSPWQWSFHPGTGEIWLGDVGQGTHEELTTVPRGGNLGWKLKEGLLCHFSPCSEDLVDPMVSLSRAEAVSITGGVFFPSDTARKEDSLYVFGDYGRGTVWLLKRAPDTVRMWAVAEIPSIVSFEPDRGGVVVVSLQSGYWHTGPAWKETGTVRFLALRDSNMVDGPDTGIVSVRHAARREASPRFSRTDLLSHPERYEIFSLDGRRTYGKPSGTVWVRESGSRRKPVLMILVR